MIGMIILLVGLAEAAIGVMVYRSMEMMVFGVIMLIGGYYLSSMERFTPVAAFMKARSKKCPLIEIERKDGVIDYDVPEYNSGSAISERYGIFGVTNEGVKNELKSGVKILHCSEGVGSTMNKRLLEVIQAIRGQYGVKSYSELQQLVKKWHVCQEKGCNFEGIFDEMEEQQFNEDKDLIGKKIRYLCPTCRHDGARIEPELEMPNGTNIEAGWPDRFFGQIQHPMLKRVITKNMVANMMEKEKKSIPIGTIAIFVSLGMMIFLACLGLVVLLPQLQAYSVQTAETAAKTVAAAAPVIIG